MSPFIEPGPPKEYTDVTKELLLEEEEEEALLLLTDEELAVLLALADELADGDVPVSEPDPSPQLLKAIIPAEITTLDISWRCIAVDLCIRCRSVRIFMLIETP